MEKEKKYIVEKRNILNELRTKNMTLQELRFFSIYLAKINARDESTRKVRFPLDFFKELMELKKVNIKQMKEVTDRLLTKVVNIPTEDGGYEAFVLFQKCVISKDENDKWYIEINASEAALPLMFNFRESYFKYELWNTLNLTSSNQLRMYEILKQHEWQGKFEIEVEELKALLGDADYKDRFDRFKIRVLDKCQKALKENTDICFTYEKGKAGKGGKWLTIKFSIMKNTEYKNKIKVEEYLEPTELEELKPEEVVKKIYLETFTEKEFNILERVCMSTLSASECTEEAVLVSVLSKSLNDFLIADSKNKIDSRLSYMKRIIESNAISEVGERIKAENYNDSEQSYSLELAEKMYEMENEQRKKVVEKKKSES